MASEELAHGQITSGRSPRAWNTLRKASQDDIDPVLARANAHTHPAHRLQHKQSESGSSAAAPGCFYGCFAFTVRAQQVDSHGLAPSATMSMRRDARLMSLWSFWASRDQCMSLDFTTATRAAWLVGHEVRQTEIAS